MSLTWYLQSTFHQTDHSDSFLARRYSDLFWEDWLDLRDWTGCCRGSTEWWSWWAGWSRTGISGRDTGSSSLGRHRPSPPPSWEDWGGLRRRMIDSPGTLRSALHCPSIPRILSSGLSRSLFWRQICFSVSQHHHYPLSDLINHQNGKSK